MKIEDEFRNLFAAFFCTREILNTRDVYVRKMFTPSLYDFTPIMSRTL